MLVITAFGILMMMLSAIMITSPQYWSKSIVNFSQQSYFHRFEILSRLSFGLIFIYFASDTLQPLVFIVFGTLMTATALFLTLIGAKKHQSFALWSANKCQIIFRPAGCCSFVFGVYIIYLSLYPLGN